MSESFCTLLDDVPDGGFAILLRAYFDASLLSEGHFSVAALAFGPEGAKKATREWQKLWGDQICHMTDLHGLHGDFEEWDKPKARKFFERSIGVLNKYVSFVSVVSCSMSDAKRLAPKSAAVGSERYLDGFRSRTRPAAM